MSFDYGANPLYRDGTHGHPLQSVFNSMGPRTVKEAFVWSELLARRSPHVYAVVRKFGEYPITKFKFSAVGASEKQRHKDLHEKHLKSRAFLGLMSFDKWLYGNAFASLYEPFMRMLVCPRSSCRQKTNIDAFEDYGFNLEKLTFRFECPACRQAVTGRAEDTPLPDPRKLNLTRWDPKTIDIKHNSLTGQSVYYHQIPSRQAADIRAGDAHLVNTTPMGMLKTVRERKLLKFRDGNLFHMKMPGPSGLQSEWGMPPVVAAVDMFLFAAALRKANEAIALEHITPFRVMFPQQQGQNGDPFQNVNLADFKDRLEAAYKDFRRDPLKVLIAPTPVGVQDIGGQGRAMLTFAELEAAEKNIMLAFGVPKEFLEGGLGQTRGEITLRMIENQLQNHIDDLNGFLAWLESRMANFLGTKPAGVRLSDFKMIDDVERKQLMLQLWGQQKVSDSTIYDMFDIDADEEREQRKADTLADQRMQMELEYEVKRMGNSLGQQAIQSAQAAKGPIDYNDQTAVAARADELVQQFMQMDEGSRASQMDNLQGTDLIMYSVVKERMSQFMQNQEQEAKAEKGPAIV